MTRDSGRLTRIWLHIRNLPGLSLAQGWPHGESRPITQQSKSSQKTRVLIPNFTQSLSKNDLVLRRMTNFPKPAICLGVLKSRSHARQGRPPTACGGSGGPVCAKLGDRVRTSQNLRRTMLQRSVYKYRTVPVDSNYTLETVTRDYRFWIKTKFRLRLFRACFIWVVKRFWPIIHKGWSWSVAWPNIQSKRIEFFR